MSQSPLVDYEAYTTYNCNAPRSEKISKVTVHHAAGILSVEGMKNIIHNPNREVSCNYAIGSDGRIGGYIREENRAWTSSSYWNDQRAVTIEVSNCATTSDWPVSDKVWNRLVQLVADICKRNGIPELTFTGDKNGTLTFHYMFTATGCPGPYIKSRANLLCQQVNAIIKGGSSTTTKTETTSTTTTTTSNVKVGDWVTFTDNGTYYDGANVPGWVRKDIWKVNEISGDRAVLGKNKSGSSNINSAVNVANLIVVESSTNTFASYTKSLTKGTPIYDKDLKTVKDSITSDAKYTIVEEVKSGEAVFGKLKSGVGYVVVSGKAPTVEIKVGDTVKVLKNVQYSGGTFRLFQSTYKVLEVNGDRVVISADGKYVTAAVNKNNLQKV